MKNTKALMFIAVLLFAGSISAYAGGVIDRFFGGGGKSGGGNGRFVAVGMSGRMAYVDW